MDRIAVESNLDRPVAIGPEGLSGTDPQPLDRRGRGMPIRIAEPGRHDGNPRSDRVEKCLSARRPGPVVGDLEEIDLGKAAREKLGIDLLFDVAGKEKPPTADLAEQHDRDVVDRAPAVGRAERHTSRVGPEHPKPNVVQGQPITGRERPVRRSAMGEERRHRGVSRTRPDHPGLVDPADPIAAQEDSEARRMVLVLSLIHI